MKSGNGRKVGLGVLAALFLALAGCGGSSDATGQVEAPAPLTKPQLLNKLDKICQGHTDRQVRVREIWQKKRGLDFEKETPPQLEKELVRVILPIVRDTIHDVKQLNPNARQKQTLKAFIEALEYGVKRSTENPSWVATGDWEPFSQARDLSWKLGTALCGQA
jgi:hypothetical protein